MSPASVSRAFSFMAQRQINQAGLELVKYFEGLRLRAYPDPATKGEPYTIGFGHTGGVKRGDVVTKADAENILRADLIEAERIVIVAVKVPLTDNQFSALCSFVFNVGPGMQAVKDGFVRLKSGQPSTMLRKLNMRDYDGAAEEFSKWISGAGKPMAGLKKRRAAERDLFLKPDSKPATSGAVAEDIAHRTEP